MGRAVVLRQDYKGSDLRHLAKMSKDAARIGDVRVQVIRDWVLRFNADGPNGLIDRKAWGQPSKLNDKQRNAVAQSVEDGPSVTIHGVLRWRLKDLAPWIFEEFPFWWIKAQ